MTHDLSPHDLSPLDLSPLDRDIVVDGVRLAYHYSPGRTGELAVFLHGTPSHSAIWRNIVPAVEAEGHGVLAYDLLGYGRSERPVARDTSVDAQAALFTRLAPALGISRCTLIAHDIGGAVAQLLVTSDDLSIDVDRLMLIDTVSYDSWPSATWQAVIREYRDAGRLPTQEEFDELLTRQLRMTVAKPDRMSGEVLATYLAPHHGELGRLSFFAHQVAHYDSTPTMRIAPALSALTLPVRILWGEADQWQPVSYGQRLAADIPTADLVQVPDAGHFLMEDAPDRVVSEILRFLEVQKLCTRSPTE